MAEKTAKKKNKINQDVLTLIMLLAFIVLVIIGFAWFDQGYNQTTAYKTGKEMKKQDNADFDGILVIATVTTVTVLVCVIGKKISNKKRILKREKDIKAKLEELNNKKSQADDDIAKILAAGRNTINSRNYHKNYFKDREEEIIDVKKHRLTMEEIADFPEDNDITEMPKNKKFYILLACIICAGIGFIIGILVI